MTKLTVGSTAAISSAQIIWGMVLSSILLVVGISADLTPQQKVEILDTFNKARATTRLSAANMKMLTWDDRLAELMQEYTNGCSIEWKVFKNPPAYFAYRDHAADPVGVAYWRTLRQAPFYDPTTGGCIDTPQSKKTCAHPEIYERLIEDDIERIGCGVTRCGPGPKGVFHACAIGGQSKPVRHPPFLPGPRCSQCPSSYPYCAGGLCSKTAPTDKPTKSPTVSRSPTRYPTRRRRRRRNQG